MPEQERGEGASESAVAMALSIPQAVGGDEWSGEEGAASRPVLAGGRVDADRRRVV